MDTIQLDVITREQQPYSEVVIRINGRNLIDIVREIELPFAQRENSPSLAGQYVGLNPERVFSPSHYFLGESVYGEKIEVLQCECETPGCWPFLVKIVTGDHHVIWSEFEQPHRRSDHPSGVWTYDKLQPFIFDKSQYLAELSKIVYPLQPHFQVRNAYVFDDFQLGWCIHVTSGFEYFLPENALTQLRLDDSVLPCQAVDVLRQFWMPASAEEQQPNSWETVCRLIYVPGDKGAIRRWLQKYLDVDRFITQRVEQTGLTIVSQNGIVMSRTIPVILEAVQPGLVYTLHRRDLKT